MNTLQYVRDCLEVLRVGAGLDNGRRVRRAIPDEWKYIYAEQVDNTTTHYARFVDDEDEDLYGGSTTIVDNSSGPDRGLTKKRGVEWEKPPIVLPEPLEYVSPSIDPSYCDPDHPRIFHMFWAGPFTDIWRSKRVKNPPQLFSSAATIFRCAATFSRVAATFGSVSAGSAGAGPLPLAAQCQLYPPKGLGRYESYDSRLSLSSKVVRGIRTS